MPHCKDNNAEHYNNIRTCNRCRDVTAIKHLHAAAKV